VAITPDGNRAYVANWYSGTVSVIDIGTNTVIATVGVGVFPVSVAITPAPLNTPPVANNQSVTTNKNTPKPITLVATDPEGDPLTYSIVAGPSHGTLGTLTGATVTYTPASGYSGSDSFTFKANDGTADSNTATVSIKVNAPPVANNQSVVTNKDVAKAITLTATDADGDPLTYSIVSGPSHGTLGTLTGATVTYTPASGYTGSDSFTFKANDGSADSNTATVFIKVNAPPVANNQSVTTNMNTAKAITLTALDAEGDPLIYSIVAGPSHGTLSGTPSNLTYTPASGYSGADSFTFKVNDGNADSNTATVSIKVNAPPVANDQSVTTNKDVAKAITLTATDPDGDSLTYSIVAGPSHGTLGTLAGATVTYTPPSGYTGSDSFTFKANDGSADSNTAIVSITVTATVCTAPTIVTHPQSQAIQSGQTAALSVTASGTAPLNYQWYRGVSGDTSSPVGTNASSYTTPALTQATSYWVRVSNSCGSVDSNTATITINAQLPGDCNGDGWTTIDEVQKAINQFLGIASVEPCCDLNGNGQVTIDEVQKVINAFLGII
jgi:YVTN family beta-propeller protein